MYDILSQEEREIILSQVTAQQREFLLNEVKRGRKTIFGNFMVKEKVSAIRSIDISLSDTERDVEDWDIVEYIDFGKGNRLGKCACNIPLRFMFTVKHKITQKTINYGKNHLADFLNIDVREIGNMLNNLQTIDYELDELLVKIQEDEFGYEVYHTLIENEVKIPKDIQSHVDANVPLLDRQQNRLYKMVSELPPKTTPIKESDTHAPLESMETPIVNKSSGSTYENLYKSLLDKHQKRIERRKEKIDNDLIQIVEATKEQLHRSSSFEEIIIALVSNGVNSAVKISWIMVEYFGISNKMNIGSMKRPYIYFDVLKVLFNAKDTGRLLLDEASDVNDCFFFVNPNPVEELTINNTPDGQQNLILF
ncbi:hypothetical protein LG296_20825 (plasmid) [Ureibacillus chungkukjangi]|uniref:hypothetical protein n=1 Tax=Ureibacillus chungkukjangi TaxID=1202712 RepID=UPI000D3476B7|nr:hypothetical protein [Ureibacillus chungkukjangi]MCM3389999.1 hypothetical protein [Ureibacillus chungkukjangi]